MKTLIACIVLIATCAVLASCNVASMASYILTPDPEQLAMHHLLDVRTVVFVDDRRNVLHPNRLKRVLADRITNDLLTKKILTTMISPADAMRVSAAHDRYSKPIPVSAIGSAVDAAIVIYVEMNTFGLTSDNQTATPTSTCSVKVIDVVNNVRLFPVDKASFPVSAKLDRIDPNRISTTSESRKVSEELASALGDSVAKLFYDHAIGRLGDSLNRK